MIGLRQTAGIAIAALWACSGDSAGTRPGMDGNSLSDFISWTEPLVQIGEDDTRPGHALNRVSGAIWMSEREELLIADRTSGVVTVYDMEGDPVREFGAAGAGPAEHGNLGGIWQVGDSLATYDASLRRVHYWDHSGKHLGQVQVDGTLTLAGITHGGAVVALKEVSVRPAGRGQSATDTVVGVFGGRSEASTGFRMPWRVRFEAEAPDGGGLYTVLPLEARGSVSVGRDHTYVGHGDSTVIHMFDSEGILAGRLSISPNRISVDDAVVQAWHAEEIGRMQSEDDRRLMATYLKQFPVPDKLAGVDTLVAGSGVVWVRFANVPGADDRSWVVYHDDELVGEFHLGAGVRPLMVSKSYAVLMTQRPDGAPVVGVYRLDPGRLRR